MAGFLPETFLELCQDLVVETPITGSFSTVEGQTGEFARVVRWVAVACLEIETSYLNWNFLSVPENDLTTIAAVSDYPVPADWNWWDHAGFGLIADEEPLEFIDWNRRKRDFQALISGDPFEFTILPDGTLRFFDTPSTIQIVRAPYWKQPTSLINNADEPLIPKRYRKVVVYRAMKLYAEYESNDEIDAKAVQGLGFWLPSLSAKELPANQGIQRVNTGTEIQVTSPNQTALQTLDLFFN